MIADRVSGFIVLLPIVMDILATRLFAGAVDPGRLENIQKMVFGALIILFLIKEPEGLARLLTATRHKLTRWLAVR